MALTGLAIFKLLPKNNCKECGLPTCLAFAMSLAAGKTTLDKCPKVSEEAKETLGGAAAPPIKLVKVGKGEKEREIGDEQVLFRHEKAFYHPTCFAIEISDKLSDNDLDKKIEKINNLVFERVGVKTSVDMVAVKFDSNDSEKYANAVKKVSEKSSYALVLLCEDVIAMGKALEACVGSNPLIYAATEENFEKMIELAKKHGAPLVVKGDGIEKTADLINKVAASYKDIVIDVGTRKLSQAIAEITQIRRLAVKKKFRTFGYPVIAFTSAENPRDEIMEASSYISKYASIVVLKADEKSQILPLTAQRLNLYTDPQKPSQVEPGIYEIGNVTPDSPVYVTTNFSLTYYTVEGEIITSKVPSYIISCPTDGTSVLTAWAAGKFDGDKISGFMEKCKIAEKVNHKNIVIPGYVAVIKGGLEEKSGWKVIVGPAEASGLPAFAKSNFTKAPSN